MLVLLVVFSLVAIQSLVECKLKWFLFPSKFFLSTQHSSAEIFSHCIICSTAVHFPTSHDALHSLNSDSPGTGFYFPSCGKIKSAPLENLGEIRVAGEDWRYPQQFSLNTNWTLQGGTFYMSQTLGCERWWGSSQLTLLWSLIFVHPRQG